MVNLEKLESLAKIKLTDEERRAAAAYFETWIKEFDKLENIDAENAEPLINAVSLENVLREDVAVKIFDRDAILENAPEHRDGYFVVPLILE